MESTHILFPAAAGLLFIFQTACIICIHRRVKRLEAAPVPQAWIPEPTHYGVPIPQWSPAPSAPPDWRGSVI
jgi:hypothetical protein